MSKGFYLVGFFSDNMRAQYTLQVSKPFVTDENGFSVSKCFVGFPRNQWAKEWLHFDNSIKDVDTDDNLRNFLNQVWIDWCKKYHRKYEPIMLGVKR